MASGTGHGRLGPEAVWPRGMGLGGAAVSLPRDLRRASRSLSLLRDDRLGARASRGDRAAFAELYRRHHQRLFRYCLAILHDAEDAADALQTTMAKALSALEGGETVRGVRPWLFRIGHNTAIDMVRGRRPQVDLDGLAETQSSRLTAPSAASEAEDRAELVQAVADIRDLPDRQAGALIMRELSGLSYPQIAAAFDTSTGNARQLVHGARSALHATRRGRDMDCEVVRLALSQGDGRAHRDPRVRAHLADCEDCRAFQRSIRTRRSALAGVVPPLVPWAAGDILGRLLERGSGSGAGLAGAGGAGVGGLAKLAGASAAAKLAAGAATVGTAVVAGGFVAAGSGLLGGADPGERAETRGFLTVDAPELRRPPTPAPALARPDRRRTPTARRAPAANGPATARRPRPAALVRRRTISRVDPRPPEGGRRVGASRDEPKVKIRGVRLPDAAAIAAIDVEVPRLSGKLRVRADGRHLSVYAGIRDDAGLAVRAVIPDIDPPDVPRIEIPDVRRRNRLVRRPIDGRGLRAVGERVADSGERRLGSRALRGRGGGRLRGGAGGS